MVHTNNNNPQKLRLLEAIKLIFQRHPAYHEREVLHSMLFLKPTFCILAFALEGDTEGQLCLNWKRPDHVASVPRSRRGAQPEPHLGERDALGPRRALPAAPSARSRRGGGERARLLNRAQPHHS